MSSLTITYGRKGGPRSGHIREGRRGVADPCFVVTPGETPPLRLNTDLGLRFTADQLAKLPDNEAKLKFLKFEIAGALDQFAQYQKRFLELYFVFIAERCRAAASELAATLDWSGGLFTAADHVFSALWPLPDVGVSLAADGRETSLGEFEFAFWTGRRVLGVTLIGGASPLVRDGKAPSGLLLPMTIAAGEMHDDAPLFTAPRFPDEFLSFWRGDAVPSSPFRPVGLADAPLEPA